MKSTTYICLILILQYSCTQIIPDNQNETNSITTSEVATLPLNSDSLRKKKEFHSRFNFTDSDGLKQGIWITKGWKNSISSFETFVNDTLHGYWNDRSSGLHQQGYYEHGKKNGYFWRLRTSIDLRKKSKYYTNIYQEFFYKNDSLLWAMSPETDMGSLIPIRGLTSTLDSVYAIATYLDGSIWYEGACVNNEWIGLHKIYFPNGELHGTVDHDKDLVIEYDSLGNFIDSCSVRGYRMQKW
mgnify:CR=1 FL=1